MYETWEDAMLATDPGGFNDDGYWRMTYINNSATDSRVELYLDRDIWTKIRAIAESDPRFGGNMELVTHLVGRGLTDYLNTDRIGEGSRRG